MLGWLKSKRSNSGMFTQMLRLPDDRYALEVESMIKDSHDASCAQILVAYRNLVPIIEVSIEDKIIGGIEDNIILSEKQLLNYRENEIAYHRVHWFIFASLLIRLEKLAKSNQEILESGIRIWFKLVVSAPKLKMILPDSVIWDDLEKSWFLLNRTDNQMIGDAINHTAPKVFSSHKQFRDLSREINQIHMPSMSFFEGNKQ